MFRVEFPALGLSLERATEAVPQDGMYHLLMQGKVVESFAKERPAIRAYEDLRQRLIQETGWTPDRPPPDRTDMLRRLRQELDARAVQAESSRSKHANRTRKGGPGR